MNLKHAITLTIFIFLNLKIYSMQENINNFDFQNVLPNEIWNYILDKIN